MDKDMGEIDDMVVNMNSGRIHYAVLEFDQSWNLNDKLISLPLRAFNYVAGDQDLILNIDKESIVRLHPTTKCGKRFQ